jgi:DNA-binding response OmpR family regulator
MMDGNVPGNGPRRRRPRVLFVDDQREVATTLSGLLASEGVECRFADNGEAGLERLLAEVFDLAILDLRMPPGDWGGLWVLRELSQRGLLVDTLVLSGEAGQSETIEAIRLGAHDFVVKDKASVELADRVRETLVAAAKARSDFAASRLPAPVALPYQRMQVPQDGEARFRAGLAAAEAAVRFSALAAIAVARARGRLDESLLSQMARPSFGTWRGICRHLLPTVREHGLGRWIEAVCVPEMDVIVRHRNDSVHGGGVPAGGVDQALTDVLGWLDFFVLTVRSGIPVDLVVAGAMTFTGTAYNTELSPLSGAARSVGVARTEVATPLVSGRVYLASANDYVDMWPLILADAGPAGDWNVRVLDGFHETRRGKTSSTDRLKYVDCQTGERLTSQERVVDELHGAEAP